MAETRNFNKATQKLNRFAKNLETNVPEKVRSRATKIAISAQNYVIAQDAIASGILLEGIDAKYAGVSPHGAGIRIKIVSDAPYSGYVEYGTGGYAEPMSPMYDAPDFSHSLVQAIFKWMLSKPTFRGTKAFYTALKIAEAISNGTDERKPGTPAQPFMRPAWRDHRYLLTRDVHSSVNSAIRKLTIGY